MPQGFISRSTLPVHNYGLFIIIKKIRFSRKEWQKGLNLMKKIFNTVS
jgi:hypothetical protein